LSLLRSIILNKGEKVVDSWWGNHEVNVTKVEKGSFGRKTVVEGRIRKNGALILTNQRLLFLIEHGIFEKSYHQVVATPLEKVGGITMGGMWHPFVCIADDVGTHVFHISGVGQEQFEGFRKLVTGLRQKRREEIEAERKKERVQVLLDFSWLKDYMEKGGMVLQNLKCSECGAPIPLPTTGNQIECKHCGSMIYAQDIFEKIKSLIG